MKKPQQANGHYAKLRDTCFFVDLSPLMDTSWTGLAQVTAHLAREIYRSFPTRSYFFLRDRVIDPYFMLAAIETAPGAYLEVLLRNGYGELGHLNDFVWRDKHSVGLFGNVKTMHGVFDTELVILHDLSAMLMPELHEVWAADLHTRALARDTASSDLVCCISDATRQDAVTYLTFDPKKAFVSHLGVAPRPRPETMPAAIPPYALVLGTIEPRKNLRLVAEFLASRTDILRDLPIVFAGRRGWGQQFNQIFGRLLEDPNARDRIVFTGFIDEADKWALIHGAKFAIFPSMFEGFGLPVAECMAAGCPVIAGRTSSVVEFGLPEEMYFDPFSLIDFSRSFRHINTMPEAARLALGAKLAQQAKKYTWPGFTDRIVQAMAAAKG
jgi:glycosyltransferase involved in cell wall biosynthesis